MPAVPAGAGRHGCGHPCSIAALDRFVKDEDAGGRDTAEDNSNNGTNEGRTSIGILPDGYVRTNPLPQIPTKQSVPPTSREQLPDNFGIPIVMPTLHSLIGPAIGNA